MNNHTDEFYAPGTISDQSRRVAVHRARRDRVIVVGLVVAAAVAMLAVFGAAYVDARGKQQTRTDTAYCDALTARGLSDPARCG